MMVAAKSANGNGFSQKALMTVLSVITFALMGFFIWLASSIVEIKVNVAEMKGTISSLVEDRKQERTAPTNTNIERNTRRIEKLEKAAE